MPTVIPSRDSILLTWAQTFSSVLGASPTTYNATAGQATALATLVAAFVSAYTTANEPTTRTRATVAVKDTARSAMKANLRMVARLAQASPTVTDAQLIEIGLTPRNNPSPINPPTEAPALEVLATMGRTLKVRLHGVSTERRGKPAGVAGASLFTYVGATPPADIADWKFEGSSSRTSFDVEFAATVPAGSPVWLTAFWFSPRAMSGPACTPVSAYIAGGVTAAA